MNAKQLLNTTWNYAKSAINGGSSRQKMQEALVSTDPTAGYHHNKFYDSNTIVNNLPLYTTWAGRLMLNSDPVVEFSLSVRNAALMVAEVEIKAKNDRVQKWLDAQWNTLWELNRDKILSAKKWGFAGLQPTYKFNPTTQLLDIDGLKDFAPEDVKALESNGKQCGFRVRDRKLFGPRSLWMTFNTEYDSPYGRGTLRRSYPPWYEKWMDRGAKKLIQQRMIKDAYVGDIFWTPFNLNVELPNGDVIPWRDLARQIAENRMSGGAMVLPMMRDDKGNQMMDYKPPQGIAGGTDIFTWLEKLDEDILRGADIPIEVIKASETGSGYSGRSIPFMVLLSVCTLEFTEYVKQIQELFRTVAWLNFGGDPDFEMKPKSLVESFAGDAAGSPMGGGAMGGNSGQPGQGGQGGGVNGPPQQQSPQKQGGRINFSEDGQLRAPVGGVTIDGKRYAGGEWIPSEVAATLTDDERQQLEKRSPQSLPQKNDDQEPESVSQKKHKPEIAIPKTEDEATEIGKAINEVIRDYGVAGETKNKCIIATCVLLAMFPGESEMWDGTIPGDWEEGGEHTIAKVGDYFIDPTAEQFNMDDVMVFTAQDLKEYYDFEAYEDFTRRKTSGKIDKDIVRLAEKAKAKLTGKKGGEKTATRFDLSDSNASTLDEITAIGTASARRRILTAAERIRDLAQKKTTDLAGEGSLAAETFEGLGKFSLLADIRLIIESLHRGISSDLQSSMLAANFAGAAEVAVGIPPAHVPPTSPDSPPPPTPPVPPTLASFFPDEPTPGLRFPVIDDALQVLHSADVFTSDDYREVAEQAKAGAFAITSTLGDEAVADIRDLLQENLAKGPDMESFVEAVQERLREGNPLSERHIETIFRTNVSSAFSNGASKSLESPMVVDAFPYRMYWATTDQRVRHDHIALEKLGLQGTNIYRADDPTWRKFRPPWDFNCRCSWNPVTVEQAARKGITEAIDWLARAKEAAKVNGGSWPEWLNKVAPTSRAWVTPPPFEPSPEFTRV